MMKNCYDIIIDSDASNSADDQIAIAYAARLESKLRIKGICAAPYVNEYSKTPYIGVNQAFSCITELLGVLNIQDKIPVLKGCLSFFQFEQERKNAEAVDFIIKTAECYSAENRLTILMIGPSTNVAAAILREPEIINKIRLVRLGGHSFSHPYNKEFNMMQDILAERIVFNADLPIVHIPCEGVTDTLLITKDEIEKLLSNNPDHITSYLFGGVVNHMNNRQSNRQSWSFPIWDLSAVAWMCNEDEEFMSSVTVDRPEIGLDGKYYFKDGHLRETYVYKIRRDAIINNLLKTIL